jgi:hypothetical protein
MAVATYVERSSLGVRIFELNGYNLTASGRWGLKPIRFRVDLRRAKPDFEPLTARLYLIFLLNLITGAVPLAVIMMLPASSVPDENVGFMYEMAAVCWLSLFVWQGWRFIRKLEFILIRSRHGAVLFSLLKDNNAPDEFELFVMKLRASIQENAVF